VEEDEKVPIEVAGTIIYVTPELRDRLLLPEGWANLSIDELAEVGIVPGMSEPGVDPPRASFRPDEK
jgi:hypothetical protein